MTKSIQRLAIPFLVLLAVVLGCSNANLVGGRNYVKDGIYDTTAVRVLRQATIELPENAEAHFLLGKVYAERSMYDSAASTLRRAADLDPTYYALRADTVQLKVYNKLLVAGGEMYKAGQYSEALDRYKKALLFRPNEVAVHQNLGSTYLKLGRSDEGVAEYLKMYELDPKSGTLALGTALSILVEEGQFNRAIEVGNKIREANPDDLEVTRTLVDIYSREADAARDMADTSTAITDTERQALKDRETKAREQVIPLYESMLRMNSEDAAAHFHLGLIQFRRGEYDPASEHFEKVVELTPDPKDQLHVDALSNLAAANMKRKQYALAEMQLRDLIAIEPNECGNYRLLSGALREQGRTDAALEAAKKYEECKAR